MPCWLILARVNNAHQRAKILYNPKIPIFCLLCAIILFCSLGYANSTPNQTNPTKTHPSTKATKKMDYTGLIQTQESVDPLKTIKGDRHAGQVNFISDYIFRGISITNHQPAAQAQYSYFISKKGIYAFLSVSNAKFKNDVGKTYIFELTPAIGITNNVGDHMSYDINLSQYNYFGGSPFNYNELNTYFNYDFITTQLSYSNNEYGLRKTGVYFNLGVRYLVPSKYTFNISELYIIGGVGYSYLSRNKNLHDYKDYNFAISKSVDRLTYAIQWTGTDGASTDLSSLKGNRITGIVSIDF